MYCSTCGSMIPKRGTECQTCGTPVRSRMPMRRGYSMEPVAEGSAGVWRSVGNCPRCDYRGEGLKYFRWGTHRVALFAATFFTLPFAVGAGGFVYYGLRHDHLVCPRCGNGWGRKGERALERTQPQASIEGAATAITGNEGIRRAWAIILMVLAAILIIGGLAGPEFGLALVGVVSGGGGFALYRSANRLREERRAAMIADLQMPVLKLAAERGGQLTVTEVAAALGWSMKRAEKILHSLDDGWRVNSEVTNDGVIVYEFREILLRKGDPDPEIGEAS